MNFEIVPASEILFTEQAMVINASFAGYVGGWTDLNAETLAKFLCLQGTDIFYSRFIRGDGELTGFGYINRTGNILRLGAMGIIPTARGTGAAGELLQHLLGEARSRGDKTMTLEVIEQNPRAVALYRRHGFRQVGRLLGWRRDADQGGSKASVSLREIPILEALRMTMVRDYPEIPWPISRHAFAKVERTRAYAHEDVCVAISEPAPGKMRVHGLFSPPNEWSKLRSLLLAIVSSYADLEFFAPPVWQEEFGNEVFQPLGFEKEKLSQFFMRYDI
jgi:ribosomal protein S18 acetylase RimI-like enzyme